MCIHPTRDRRNIYRNETPGELDEEGKTSKLSARIALVVELAVNFLADGDRADHG